MDDSLLTVAEAATWLKVDKHLVYRAIRSGKLPAAKIGSLYRIHAADLREYAKPATPQRKPRTQRDRIASLIRSA